MKKQGWKEYFVFSRKERNGAIVLAVVIVALMISPYFIPDRPLSATEKQLLAEKATLPERSPVVFTGTLGNSTNRVRYDKPETPLFYFDPNTLSIDGWVKLGISGRTAQTIGKYRSKGGKFKKPEDLAKIYGLRQSDLNRLLSYVRIEVQPASSVQVPRQRLIPDSLQTYKSSYSSPSAAISNATNNYTEVELLQHERKKDEASHRPPVRKYLNNMGYEGKPVDLNKADSLELMQLPGIGSKLAARILKFRNGLGGFYSVDQVREVYGLPQELYGRLHPLLQCDSSAINRININNASLDELARHPYIRYAHARQIVQYRNQHGTFKTVDDLMRIAVIDAEWLKRLRPYIRTDS